MNRSTVAMPPSWPVKNSHKQEGNSNLDCVPPARNLPRGGGGEGGGGRGRGGGGRGGGGRGGGGRGEGGGGGEGGGP